MRPFQLCLLELVLLSQLVAGHSDHTFDLNDENDAGMPYAERHMHTEHHIDSFDLESFFKLHDLDMNNYWDRAEIEAVYGLHHHSIIPGKEQAAIKSGRGPLGDRAPKIVAEVLRKLDKNHDDKISLQEFLDGGPEGLPSFDGYKDLGHHYDEESEYFLHHEELYHNSPETQTDESYTHPEDIEHFQHHAHIEAEEDARERKFEGLDEDADISKNHVAEEDALDRHAHAPGEGPPPGSEGATEGEAQKVMKAGDEAPPPPRLHREGSAPGPARLEDEVRREWEKAKGAVKGDKGHGRAASGDERLRTGGTYKSKFRKGLRSDEF